MRVLLHIGYTKTGTTSIQRALYENRELIKSYNCYYPECGVVDNHHFYLAHNIIGPSSPFFDPGKGRAEDLLEEMTSLPSDTTVVLSCETMIRYSDEQIERTRDLFKDHDVTIVAYLRRQDFWLNSQFIQAKKNIPFILKQETKRKAFKIAPENIDDMVSETFEEFCAASSSRPSGQSGNAANWRGSSRPSGDYFNVLEAWAKHFGTQNILVRIFEREKLAGGDAVTDFASLLGAPTDSLSLGVRSNKSPDWKSCIASLQLVNHAREVTVGLNNWAVSFAASALNTSEQVLAWNEDADGFLTLNTSRKILSKYEESNRKLAEKYLGGEFPFSDASVENLTERHVDQIPRQEYIDALSSSLIKISKDLVKSINQVKRLESDLASLREDRTQEMDSVDTTPGGSVNSNGEA
jgi:hypothetical protein